MTGIKKAAVLPEPESVLDANVYVSDSFAYLSEQ